MQDIFNSKEFKSLKWNQKLMLRLKVAFFEMIRMF